MSTKLFDLSKFDEYSRRARIYPALFVLLPLIFGVLVWFPEGFKGLSLILSILAWAGVSYFFANVARDSGKEKESDLYEMWGGKPTTTYLRHRDTDNSEMLRNIHQTLSTLFPDVSVPSQQEEERDPEKADDIYDTCTRKVIERTRDKKKFDILFNENCSYGFRRNLWGMKSIGVIVVIIGLIISVAGIMFTYSASGEFEPLAVAVSLINFLLLLVWILRITPKWVRIPANAYAERLFASLERI